MKKKGLILDYFMIVAIALGFGFYYASKITGHPDYQTTFTGEMSLEVFKVAQNAEKILVYIGQSAKLSAQQSIYDLAEKGGIQEPNICGDNLGYSTWIRANQYGPMDECYPNKALIEANLKVSISQWLDEFASQYPQSAIPQGNYLFELKNSLDIIGRAKSDITIPIGKKDKPFGTYSINPSFKVHADYNLEDYSKLAKKTKNLMQACEAQSSKEPCIELNKRGFFEEYDSFGNTDFEVLEVCETEERAKFMQFLWYFDNCYTSENKNCACRQRMPDKGRYNIIKKDQNIEITGSINSKNFKHTLQNVAIKSDLEDISSQRILHRDSEGLIVSRDFAESLLKKDEKYEDKFPVCSYKPKTKFNFCVRKKNKQVLAYEEDDKSTNAKDIIYKFSVEFKEPIGILPQAAP